MLYKARTGNSNVPARYKTDEGYQLGYWQSHRRQAYKKGELSPERIKRLEEIDFTWELLEEQFEKGFQETLLYRERTGNPNAPKSYKTAEGYLLGSWQGNQRNNYKKGNLSPNRIRQFEEIGFTWEKLEEKFEKGFQQTLLYKESTGNPNTPTIYKTTEGFRLGSWQNKQRISYKKGELSPERIKRLEESAFTWELLEEQFERGFQETLLYKEKTGNPNATVTYKTAEGFLLGSWQSNQRRYYKNGKLSPDRTRLLEKIGFIWEMLEEQFEKGFQETLLYKKSTGNPNAPARYKTAEGFQLGKWQGTQRGNYKKGILSPDRIKRFEAIGFKWRKQR